MTIDTDLATLRKGGTLQHQGTEDNDGWTHSADCEWCAALDRVEAELARLQDGLRLAHEFARERLEDGHPGLLDMHLVEDKLRALLADTPDHAPPDPR